MQKMKKICRAICAVLKNSIFFFCALQNFELFFLQTLSVLVILWLHFQDRSPGILAHNASVLVHLPARPKYFEDLARSMICHARA